MYHVPKCTEKTQTYFLLCKALPCIHTLLPPSCFPLLSPQLPLSLGKWSNSLLPTSRLELQPKLNADGTPAKVHLNPYAQYVKDHYADVKLHTPHGGHKEVMKRLREQYYSSRALARSLDGSFSD